MVGHIHAWISVFYFKYLCECIVYIYIYMYIYMYMHVNMCMYACIHMQVFNGFLYTKVFHFVSVHSPILHLKVHLPMWFH